MKTLRAARLKKNMYFMCEWTDRGKTKYLPLPWLIFVVAYRQQIYNVGRVALTSFQILDKMVFSGIHDVHFVNLHVFSFVMWYSLQFQCKTMFDMLIVPLVRSSFLFMTLYLHIQVPNMISISYDISVD